MGNLKSFLVGLTTFLGATALTAGGIALNNHFNKENPITLSYGDKIFFGEKVDSDATDTPIDDVQVETSLDQLNEICAREDIMMMIVVNNSQNLFESQVVTIHNANEIESALSNTFIQQNIESQPNYNWKGWSLDPEGEELITDYSSIFKKEAVIVYAISEECITYHVQLFNNIYQFKAGADGKVDSLPMDMSAQAPEGYTFLGFSTVSEQDTTNIVDLTEITIGEYSTYYAVFVDEDGQAFNYLDEATKITLNYIEGLDNTNFDNYYYNGNYQINFSAPSINNIDGTTFYFVGWYTDSTVADSIDPEKTIEDLYSYTPTGDMQLYALYQVDEGEFVTVNQLSVIKFEWQSDIGLFTSGYITTIDDMTSATNYAKTMVPTEIAANKEFVGWSTVANDPESIVDFSTISATANTTYYAIFDTIEIITLTFTDSDYSSDMLSWGTSTDNITITLLNEQVIVRDNLKTIRNIKYTVDGVEYTSNLVVECTNDGYMYDKVLAENINVSFGTTEGAYLSISNNTSSEVYITGFDLVVKV